MAKRKASRRRRRKIQLTPFQTVVFTLVGLCLALGLYVSVGSGVGTAPTWDEIYAAVGLAEPLPADDLLAADDAEGPEAQTLRREQAETLRRLLLGMAADDREIFVRFYYYRQTVREIASVMEKNESTVKARLARGRARLRDKLTKEVDGYADL